MKDTYGWTLNICINPLHLLMIVIWIGDKQYIWIARRPFRLSKTMAIE